MATEMAIEITILTLNVWGIPFISNDRMERIEAIGDEISKGTYDIVSLQEVWSEEDYNVIKKKVEEILPYSHYFYSGVMGAGLCVLSKHPIVSAFFHAWSVNGYFHRIQHADWFGGKGVGLCRILIDNKIVNIYNAHLHAEYDNQNDEYKTHRVIQAFDTAQFIKNTRGNSILQILAGDLNTQPDEICYRTLLTSSKMFDCCTKEYIGTNECSKNSYSSLNSVKKNPIGLRIDHVFARAGKNYKLFINEYQQPFPDRVPGQKFSYSDHEAVCVRLKIIETDHSALLNLDNNIDEKHEKLNHTIEALQESLELCDLSLRKLKTDRIFYYTISIFLTFLLIAVIDYSVPYGFKTLYLFFKCILISCLIFSLFMSTIWNSIERNGILSGKHSMQISLRNSEYLKIQLL